MLRVVLDTNVFVSSLLIKEGIPAQVLDTWRDGRYLPVVSPAVVSEIRSALEHPRIRRKYQVSDQEIRQLITLLSEDAIVVPGTASVAGSVPNDPSDEIVLACAMDGAADLIVSGDRHLLELGTFQSIPIVTVRAFLERLQSEAAPRGQTE